MSKRTVPHIAARRTDTFRSRLAARFARVSRKSATLRVIYVTLAGAPSWSKRDVQAFSEEGYKGNPYMYAACEQINRGAAEPPPVLYRMRKGSRAERAYKDTYDMYMALDGFSPKKWSKQAAMQQVVRAVAGRMSVVTGLHPSLARRLAIKSLAGGNSGELEEIHSHPILDLLARPNGWYQTNYSEFVKAYQLSLSLAGEAFTEPIGARGTDNAPQELYVLPPHLMRPVRGSENHPIAEWSVSGRRVGLTYSPDPMETDLFFDKFYDPVNPLRGLAPVEAAMRSIDLNNMARLWNFRHMKHAGVPPGLVTGEFDEAGGQDIKDEYEEQTTGDNVGRIVTIGGTDLKYHQLSMDAAKLQWGDVLKLSAREVAIIFSTPPETLGDSENKTYSNYKEARLALYHEGILPRIDFQYRAWNASWVTRFGDDLMLDYDSDQMFAIQDDIRQAYERLDKAGFMTLNEKRAAAFLPTVVGGDVIFVPINMIPLEAATDTAALAAHTEFITKALGLEA